MLNTISPSIPQGALGGGFIGGHKFKSLEIYQTAGPKFGARLQIHLGMDIG